MEIDIRTRNVSSYYTIVTVPWAGVPNALHHNKGMISQVLIFQQPWIILSSGGSRRRLELTKSIPLAPALRVHRYLVVMSYPGKLLSLHLLQRHDLMTLWSSTRVWCLIVVEGPVDRNTDSMLDFRFDSGDGLGCEGIERG